MVTERRLSGMDPEARSSSALHLTTAASVVAKANLDHCASLSGMNSSAPLQQQQTQPSNSTGSDPPQLTLVKQQSSSDRRLPSSNSQHQPQQQQQQQPVGSIKRHRSHALVRESRFSMIELAYLHERPLQDSYSALPPTPKVHVSSRLWRVVSACVCVCTGGWLHVLRCYPMGAVSLIDFGMARNFGN